MELSKCFKHCFHLLKGKSIWRETNSLLYPLLRMNFSESEKDYYS